MPKKAGRSGTKKTATKRTYKKKTAAKVSPGKEKSKSLNMVPIYVLSIMVLLTALILMANHFKSNGKFITDTKTAENKTKEDSKKSPKDIKNKNKDNKINADADKEDSVKSDADADKNAAEQKEFQIYLVKFDRQNEKMSLYPVKRKSRSPSPLSAALNELIKGPNKSEKRQGLLSAIPDELKLRSVQISGKSAVLDFNDAIEEDANGEILLTRIDQLVYTATQFDGVENVVIKVNGRQKKFLGGEGLSVGGPIGRRGTR